LQANGSIDGVGSACSIATRKYAGTAGRQGGTAGRQAGRQAGRHGTAGRQGKQGKQADTVRTYATKGVVVRYAQQQEGRKDGRTEGRKQGPSRPPTVLNIPSHSLSPARKQRRFLRFPMNKKKL
jgi:hypothetical protein